MIHPVPGLAAGHGAGRSLAARSLWERLNKQILLNSSDTPGAGSKGKVTGTLLLGSFVPLGVT